jgi:hypothetical protein
VAKIFEPLTEVAPDVFTLRRPFPPVLGDLGARMTIVRLSGRELWVHSPVAIEAAAREEIARLGEVAHVAAPSRFHYLDLQPFSTYFPKAQVYAPEAVVKRKKGLKFAGTLKDGAPSDWSGEIEQLQARGHPMLDEVAFLHKPSRTLILTDLLMTIHKTALPTTRAIGKVLGIYEVPAVPVEIKWTWNGKEAGKEFIEQLLSWDFDRILYSHGSLIETGGKDALRRAYSFLLERG